MRDNFTKYKLSVIIPVCERTDSVAELYPHYKNHCSHFCSETEFIYVTTTSHSKTIIDLRKLQEQDGDLALIVLNRDYGEATAIQAGVASATGDYILTLPPYQQVVHTDLVKLFDQIGDHDIALGKRWPRCDGNTNQLQTRTFNYLLKKLSGLEISDIGCGVRLIKSDVLKETHMYGDQWRFLPLLAYQNGFHSTEVELTQADEDSHSRIYKPGLYLRRLLDLLTIVFLTKFNKKPLRFFGLIGSSAILTGIIGLTYLAIERLFFGIELANRPLLVLFSLFFVLGCQLIAIGLVGETVIFTHAKNKKEYKIKEVINKLKKD